jgi:uncharacterized protein YxjI
METFELTQKLLSWGPQYEVRDTMQAGQDVLVTIKGKVLSATPKLTMVQGSEGPTAASMKGNFMKTKFECFDANDKPLGVLAFPMLALKKGFTISAGGQEFKADGGFLGGEFKCTDAQGNVVMTIAKQLSLRDKFAITTTGALPRELALLAAVAIDQRFFQETYD